MQSSNPVFSRSAGFNGRGGAAYADFGSAPQGAPAYSVGTARMTVDTVVQKSAITLGTVVLAAAATWILTGDIITTDPLGGAAIDSSKTSLLYTLILVGGLGAFALSMVNSFKRVISPGLVIAYAVLEGIALGAISKIFQLAYDGVVTGAVVGTVAAVAGTFAAYKYLNIQVGDRFRKWTIGMMFGFVAVTMLDFVLSLFGGAIGFNGFGPLGLITSFVGLGIGVLMLILDFDFVERGVAAGLPEQESWRAAFAFTVTIVWIYVELLRILAILRGD